VPGFLFLKRSKFILISGQKQKYPQIATQFWVYACYELPLGKRASVILELPFKIYFDKRTKTKIPANCNAILGLCLL
jgi:hypothetical protein